MVPDPTPFRNDDSNTRSDSTDGNDSTADNDDYGCPKCGHTDAEVGSISTTGGGISKMFDIQTNRFNVVSCTSCGYSELYRDVGSGTSDIVDIFLG